MPFHGASPLSSRITSGLKLAAALNSSRTFSTISTYSNSLSSSFLRPCAIKKCSSAIKTLVLVGMRWLDMELSSTVSRFSLRTADFRTIDPLCHYGAFCRTKQCVKVLVRTLARVRSTKPAREGELVDDVRHCKT